MGRKTNLFDETPTESESKDKPPIRFNTLKDLMDSDDLSEDLRDQINKAFSTKKANVNSLTGLLDLLKQSSLDERQKLILSKYEKEFADFVKKLGSKEFAKMVLDIGMERIEGKLEAMK